MPTASASLGERLRALPQYLLPQRTISRAAYRITRVRAPWFKNRLIAAFSRHFGVDLSEAAEPDPRAYPHFNAFFTRALRAGVRPVAAGSGVVCCPVDGAVSQIGAVDDEQLLQAKGRVYTLTELLAGAGRAAPFRGGAFATLYLSPRDYHRVHLPLAGRLTEMIHVPGKLFSVSPLTASVVPRLFARNERLVCLFDTVAGPMALILVGAINVGSMETVWAGQVTPPYGGRAGPRSWRYDADAPGPSFAKGDEVGRFNMGSTVIVLFGPGAVRWDAALSAGAGVTMGQAVGEVLNAERS